MQNFSDGNHKINQDKKKDFIKRLFQKDGVLHQVMEDLPKEKHSVFFNEFLKNDGVQAAINNFLEAIDQIHLALKTQTETNVNAMNEPKNNTNAQSRVLTPSGDSMLIENSSISKVSITTLNIISSEVEHASSTEPISSADENHTQTASSAKSAITPPSVAQVEKRQQLKPGEIPSTSAPATKLAPVSELSKTSFAMSANGRANEVYRGKISGVNKSGKNILIKQVDIPVDLGLSFDSASCEVFGIPTLAGEFELKVHFQFDHPSSSDPTPVGICQLIVNPDPKTLWKNLESDKSDKYWKEDTATVFVPGSDGLAIIVASKRGRSHAHAGTFRDDDFRVDHDVITGWRIMTVADGAGSAKKSRRGSQIATKVANESVFKGLKGEKGQKLQDALIALDADPSKAQRPVMEELYYLFGNAAREAVHAINTEATNEGVPYKEFSTTLIITVHKKFDFGHFIGAYWVGDGGAGIYLKGQELNVLGKADSGEFAGQTRFLDSTMVEPSEIMNRIRFKVVQDFTAVITMTDGITDPKFETDTNIENSQMWDALWAELEPSTKSPKPNEALLDWLDFWSSGNHDDRTIGILCPIKPGNSLQRGLTDE